MGERGTRKSDRYRWWISERSGFEFGFQPLTSPPNEYSRESGRPIYDNGVLIAPEEYDTPPPSTKSLGGEGEIGTGARANAESVTVPPGFSITVIYVNSSNSIAWNDQPVVQIAGNLVAQVMAVNPQIQPGTPAKYIALECVGSSVTLINGSGITFDFNKPRVVMESGSIATIFYNATDSTWHMTSFNPQGGF